MERNLNDIILSLKILENIKYGEKLCIRNNCLDINSWAISRFYYNDTRVEMLNYLDTMFLDLSTIIDKLMNNLKNEDRISILQEETSYTLQNVCYHLRLSKKGISNLILTYTNDITTISKLDIMYNNVDIKIRKISDLLILK